MATIQTPTIPLSKFFELADDSDPVDLVDIVNDRTSNKGDGVNYLNSPGCFVYEIEYLLNMEECKKFNVEALGFSFKVPDSRGIEKVVFESRIPIVNANDKIDSVSALVSSNLPVLQDLIKNAPQLKSNARLEKPVSSPSAVAASLSKSGIDPAKLLSSGRIVNSTPSFETRPGMNNGIFQKPASPSFLKSGNFDTSSAKSVANTRIKNQLNDLSSGNSLIISSLLPQDGTSNSRQKNMPIVKLQIVPKMKKFVQQFSIDKSQLKGISKFTMEVKAFCSSSRNLLVKESRYTINQNEEISDFIGNPDPPRILACKSEVGIVRFDLQKVDPLLNKVGVVRITKNPNTLSPKIEWRGSITFQNDTLTYTDIVENSKPNEVLYRFMSQNADGSFGKFESRFVDTFSSVIHSNSNFSAKTPISIRAVNTADGISVSVYVLTDDIFTLRLMREEIGANNTKIIYPSSKISDIVVNNNITNDLTWLDRDVLNGRRYRYFAIYTTGYAGQISRSIELVSDEDDIITRIAPVKLPFIVSSDKTPSFSTDTENSIGTGITYTIPLSLQNIQDDFNPLINSLKNAGVASKFLTELQSDSRKEKLASVFMIERIDRMTGVKEIFGFYEPGTSFVDSPTERKKRGVSDFIPGNTYEYILKLCVRPAEAFLQSSLTSYVNDTQDEIKVKINRFLTAYRSPGVLPSESDVKFGKSIRQIFEDGLTGVEVVIGPVNLRKEPVSIAKISVKKKKAYNLISWSVIDAASKVDSFHVYCSYNGSLELLGTCSTSGKGSNYLFRDNMLAQEVGEKKYFVRALDSKLNVIVQSNDVSTSKLSDFPPKAFGNPADLSVSISPGNILLQSKEDLNFLKNSSAPLMNSSTENFLANANPTLQGSSIQKTNSALGLVNTRKVASAANSTILKVSELARSNIATNKKSRS